MVPYYLIGKEPFFMKRITEAQIRQVIREEIIKLLNEASEISSSVSLGFTTFAKLLAAQEDDKSPVQGPSFKDLQKQVTTLKPNTKVEIKGNKKLNTYTAFIPFADHMENFTISTGIVKKLGLIP